MTTPAPIKLDPSKLMGFKQIKALKEGKIGLAQAMVGNAKVGYKIVLTP
jgi:hypothetical protein